MLVERIKTVDRVYKINNILLQKQKNIYRLRKICAGVFEDKFEYAYVISLTKNHKSSIEEMVEEFYTLCKSILLDVEILITNNKRFKIVSDEFEVTYYIEAWRKTADKLAYIENGKVKTELLHRMSCEQASSIYRELNVKPFSIINTVDFLKKYDNHADKYVALAKACKYKH